MKTRAVARKQLLSVRRARPSTALSYLCLVLCHKTQPSAQRTELLREDQGGRQEAAAQCVQGQAQHSPVVLVSGALPQDTAQCAAHRASL